MDINQNKKEISKRPWWYLFLIANFCIILGCAITYFLFKKIDSGVTVVDKLFIPTLACNIASFIALVFFLIFEYKDIIPKQMHFQRKWIYVYVVSVCFFFLAIVFSIIFFIFIRDNWVSTTTWNASFKQIMLIIYLAITALLTLLSIGINRYARFRIDLDVYRRKHGQNPNDKKLVANN